MTEEGLRHHHAFSSKRIRFGKRTSLKTRTSRHFGLLTIDRSARLPFLPNRHRQCPVAIPRPPLPTSVPRPRRPPVGSASHPSDANFICTIYCEEQVMRRTPHKQTAQRQAPRAHCPNQSFLVDYSATTHRTVIWRPSAESAMHAESRSSIDPATTPESPTPDLSAALPALHPTITGTLFHTYNYCSPFRFPPYGIFWLFNRS